MSIARMPEMVTFLTLFTLLKLGENLSAAFAAAQTQRNSLANI